MDSTDPEPVAELAAPTVAAARHELKLVCEESAFPELAARLRAHPSGLRRAFPDRTVQSVYLDTPFQRALEDNVAGIGRREKLRVRWYGEETELVTASLELKRRANSLGWKDVHRLGGALRVEGVARFAFLRELVQRAPEPWRGRLRAGLEPVQWIAYRRSYHVTADGAVRVTFDRALRAWDLRPKRRLSRRGRTPLPRLLVVELKCPIGALERAQGLVGTLGVSVDRCSKFALASRRDAGPHPSLLQQLL